METNNFKRQKQELEEVRNESFKQGVRKGKQELWDDIFEPYKNVPVGINTFTLQGSTLKEIKKRHNLK